MDEKTNAAITRTLAEGLAGPLPGASHSAGQIDPSGSLEALLEGIGEGFFALDASWRFTAFNPSAEAIFGLSRADVIGT